MIISVDKLYDYGVGINKTREYLTAKLEAVEHSIRQYTHNHFLNMKIKSAVSIADDLTVSDVSLAFKVGDTVELFHTDCDGLYTITELKKDGTCRLSPDPIPSLVGSMVKVSYPPDVVMGAIAMLSYDLNTEGMENVASESISRHSVTYRDGNGSNTLMGYPLKLTSFLKAYRKVQ